MDDPMATVLAILSTDWNLSGALIKTAIRFTTGWYNQDLDVPQVAITHDSERMKEVSRISLTKVNVEHKLILMVSTFSTALLASSKGPELAKAQRWSMRQEVLRVIQATPKSNDDIEVMIPDGTIRYMDDYSRKPQLFRADIPILCTWEEEHTVA